MPGDVNKKFFSHEKSNLARQGLTQLFHIDPEHGLIVSDGTSTKRYDDYYRKNPKHHDDKLEAAKQLILENVDDDGCIYARDAYQLAKEAEISESTMKAAKSDLGMIVPSKKDFQGKTIWQLETPLTSEDMKDINNQS